jgi:hypothetical protein
MTSVLIVVSAADRWTLNDGTTHPTGYWAEELAEPHRIFASAGWDITVATPGGVAPTADRLSLGLAGACRQRPVQWPIICAGMIRCWPIRRCSPTPIPTTMTWCSIPGVTAPWRTWPSTPIPAGS